MTPARCTGAIIAGGAGSRLGGVPKGLLDVGGRRMVDRVADALRGECDDLLVVANTADAAAWVPDASVTTDRRPGLGALGGIHAALAATGGDVVVVAWDMPFVSRALIRAMRDASAGVDAVVPERAGSRWGVEPLCAWYGRACLAPVERAIEAGDARAGGWLDRVKVARMGMAALRSVGDPATMLFDVDTEDDLTEARAMAAARLHAGHAQRR
jgi:molybdopterin-guanine dinucleotide biosynthesis protein A